MFCQNLKDGEIKALPVQGVFVFVATGMAPNSEGVKDLVKLNSANEIKIDYKTQMTSMPGIFAAGDVTDVLFKQSIVAAGDGAKAALSVDRHLKDNSVTK